MRWVPLVAALLAAAAGVALGIWQLSRAHEKRALQEQYAALAHDPAVAVSSTELKAADVMYRKVAARGVFDPRYAIYIDNRILHGVPGYQVVTPLALGRDRYVLVNRGWVAAPLDRSQLPAVRTPDSTVEITGVAIVPQKPYELSSHVMQGRVWENLTIERYRDAFPLAIQPFVIQQENALDDGLAREWSAPDLGIERHYGYAVQWFLLAATAIAFFGVTHVRRSRKPG